MSNLTKAERLAVLVGLSLISVALSEVLETKLSSDDIDLLSEELLKLEPKEKEVVVLSEEEELEQYEELRKKLGLTDSDLKEKLDQKTIECRELKQSQVDTKAIQKYASEILKIVK